MLLQSVCWISRFTGIISIQFFAEKNVNIVCHLIKIRISQDCGATCSEASGEPETQRKVYIKTKGKNLVFPFCGATWNRTRDTRIFSPLLYQLSYGTVLKLGFKQHPLYFGVAKVYIFLKSQSSTQKKSKKNQFFQLRELVGIYVPGRFYLKLNYLTPLIHRRGKVPFRQLAEG